MERVPAFTYLYDYYLLPEEYASAEAFLSAAQNRPTLHVTQLCENDCIAPYFIAEDTQTVTLRLREPERVHPVEVYLMPREEYAARLREVVAKTCPGCRSYTSPAPGEPPDLEGHAREITLDGLCLIRCDGTPEYNLTDAVNAFWDAVLAAEDAIRKPLLAGDLLEARDALSGIYRRFLPCHAETLCAVVRAVGGRVMMFGSLSNEARMVNRFVASCAPEAIKNNWMILDYIPRGTGSYIPLPAYDLTGHPPTATVFKLPDELGRYPTAIFCPPAPGDVSPVREVFRYLYDRLGEDFCATRLALRGIEPTASYTAYPPLHTVVQAIRQEEGKWRFRQRATRKFRLPCTLSLPAGGTGSHAAAELIDALAPDLVLEMHLRTDGTSRMLTVVDKWQLALCTLSLTPPDRAAGRHMDALMRGELLADLCQDGLILPAACTVAGEGERLFYDFIAPARGEALEALRDMSPEFAGFDPRLIVRTRRGTCVYRVSYTFDLVRFIPAEPDAVQEVQEVQA